MLTLKTPKADNKYFCEHCNFGCNKISGYNKHLLTSKHERLTNPNKLPPNDKPHMCGCGKRYKHRQSLYIHRKKCLFINSENEEVPINDNKMIPNDKPYVCDCGKGYTYDSGYYRHKKTCTFINSENKEVPNNDKETQTDNSFQLITPGTKKCHCNCDTMSNSMSNLSKLIDQSMKNTEHIDMLLDILIQQKKI